MKERERVEEVWRVKMRHGERGDERMGDEKREGREEGD